MDIQQLKTAFDGAVTEMKGLLTAQAEEIKKFGVTREETGKRIDDVGARLEAIAGDFKALQKRADELEVKMNRPGFGGAPAQEEKSLGQLFVESEQYQAMVKANGKTSNPMPVKSLFQGMERKDLSGDGAAGSFPVQAQRVMGIQRPAERAFRLRDLIPVAPTGSNAIEYVEETGYNNLYTELAAGAAAVDTEITVKNTGGLYKGQVISIGGTAAAISLAADAITPATGVVKLQAAVGAVKAVDTAVTSKVFGGVAEKGKKPQAQIQFELKNAAVKTLPHWIPATQQILSDSSQLRAYIDGRLVYGLKLSEEEQVLYGDGTGQNLEGFMVKAGVQTYDWASGPVTDTKLDALRRAMTKARLAEYPVTGVILNPTDWEDIELAKGSDGHYLWVMVTTGGQQVIWRVPVVDTTAVRPGQYLLGAFGQGAMIWDREQASIRTSDQHEDFFTRNMVAVLAEERLALTIFRPEAFVKGDISTPPAP